MATLRDIKASSERLGVKLSTKQINFIHKNQFLAREDLSASYQDWFAVEPDPETLEALGQVYSALNSEAQSVESLEEDQSQPESPAEDALSPTAEENQEQSQVNVGAESKLEGQDEQAMAASSEAEAEPLEQVSEHTSLTTQEAPEEESEEHGLDGDEQDSQDATFTEALEPEPPLTSEQDAVIEPVAAAKPFSPWWNQDEEPREESVDSERNQPAAKPDVSAYLDVVRRLDSERFEALQVFMGDDGAIQISWEKNGEEATYVVCGDIDHYPFEVTVDNALAVTKGSSLAYQGGLNFFTVFSFLGSNAKGVAWAKGRFVSEIDWFTAEVVDGKVSLAWSSPEPDLELRVAKSFPDQALVEVPTANFWLPVSGKTGHFLDTQVELGRRYQYRAYQEWVGPDGAVHATPGVTLDVNVVIDFPKVLSFEAALDTEVSGRVTCLVEGINQPDLVEIFEFDGLPSEQLIAATKEHRQLKSEDLSKLAVKSWLGQAVVGERAASPRGVSFSTVLTNASKASKTFALVLKLGSVAQVAGISTVQRVGEIVGAKLIERYDYQLIRLDEPTGAQSLDIWIVASAVPFEQISHTQPNRRVLIQEEYLRYGGILFAENVPNKPQIRKLAPEPQTIYIRGASTFEGETEFGSVIQVNYPGRLVLTYLAEPQTQVEEKPANKPKRRRLRDLFNRKPKTPKVQAEIQQTPTDATPDRPATNKRIDAIGKTLIAETKVEDYRDDRSESLLQRVLRALTPKGRKKKKVEQPDGPRLLIRVDGAESVGQLETISALHFASDSVPLDEHDSKVSKSPLDVRIAQHRGRFLPYKVGEGETGEPKFLTLEKSFEHRFQIQSEMPGDFLNGVRCFSVDGAVDLEQKKKAPSKPSELELSMTVIGPSGSGKSSFLASLTHYMQEQYELLLRAELVENDEAQNSLRGAARRLSVQGDLPARGIPITGSNENPTSTLRLVSKSALPLRKLKVVDTSGVDFSNPESLELASEFLLSSDLLVVTIDPTRNPTVAELSSGLVSKPDNFKESDEPFWLMETIVNFLNANSAARNPKQRVAICVTKFDAIEVANEIYGTSLTGTIRSGMAMSRDPHLLWSGEYLESFGLLQDKEVKTLLGRVSGYGPFLQLVQDSFDSKSVRFFGVSALGRSNFSKTLGGGGLTPTRISDPLRWAIYEQGL